MLFVSGIAEAADLVAPSQYEGKSIEQIRYEPELQPLTRAELGRLVPFRVGSMLSLDAVRETIKRLYATGLYSYIEADTEPAPRGVTLIFRTRDQWFIGPVRVEGHLSSPPNAGQIVNAARLGLGEPLDEGDLQQAVDSITDLLHRNGLFLASIVPKVEREPKHQQVSVTFTIDTGNRARLSLPRIIGDTRIPAPQLAQAAGYQGFLFLPWKPATDSNVSKGLRRIRSKYEKADRLTASVSLENLDYLKQENRIRPVISAEGGPIVKIETEGASISRGKLRKYVPVFDLQAVNRDFLVRGAGNLRDHFQDQGYFDAQVDFQIKEVDPDHENITYVIHLGDRSKLVRVLVRGNRYFSANDIRERMYLQPAGFLHLRHGRYSTGLAERDEDAIQTLYEQNGFRDVHVAITTVRNYRGASGEVAATVQITEGPQYKVSAIQVEGVKSLDKEQIVSQFVSVPGQPYSVANVALDRDYILNLYYSTGFPDASFAWAETPGPGPAEMQLSYVISEGQQRFVRDVLLLGLRHTSRKIVDPYVLLKPDDPLSWTRMGAMQRELYSLGIFDNVNMAIQNPQGDTESKYVLYDFTEGSRYYMGLGAGAEIARIGGSPTSLNNPGGAAGFSPRGSVQLGRTNLWGLGHSLNFNARYSNLDRRLTLNYLAPRFRNVAGRDISLTGLYDNTRDVVTFTGRQIEGTAQISQKFSRSSTGFLRYTWRDVRVFQAKIDPLLIPLVSQPAQIAMISANLIQDRRDDPLNAHRGYYNSVDIGLADHIFGGNKNFLRFLVRNSYFKPFKVYYVLASNTTFGVIWPFGVPPNTTNLEYVPIAEHFFGGGSASDRGFPENQAGPRDLVTGFPIGGNALLFHSTEVRFPMIGANINGVLFHDFGNVFTGFSKISFRVHQRDLQDFDYMVHAVGLGVRYKTPVGPVRVDLAYSINPPRFFGLVGSYQDLLNGTATPQNTSVSHFQFFFSIGQAF